MKIAINRLSESARPTLARHFLALPMRDRCLRFGVALAPAIIATYVDQIDLDRDAVLGVHDSRNLLVGVAHVAVGNEHAELALSVLPMYRRRGIGSALFKRAVAHARRHGIAKLFMHCLSVNAPIMRIAQKFGMDIVAEGGNADAHLDLKSTRIDPVDVMRDRAFGSAPAGLSTRSADMPTMSTHWSRILYHDLLSENEEMLVAPPTSSRDDGRRMTGPAVRAATILLAVFIAMCLAVALALHILASPDDADVEADSSVAPAWAVAMSTPLFNVQRRQWSEPWRLTVFGAPEKVRP